MTSSFSWRVHQAWLDAHSAKFPARIEWGAEWTKTTTLATNVVDVVAPDAITRRLAQPIRSAKVFQRLRRTRPRSVSRKRP